MTLNDLIAVTVKQLASLRENGLYLLRWLNTVLRAVSGNSRDHACF